MPLCPSDSPMAITRVMARCPTCMVMQWIIEGISKNGLLWGECLTCGYEWKRY